MSGKHYECIDFKWRGIEKIEYKPAESSGGNTFFEVTRQNLFIGGDEADFDMRYFECAPGGYTTLEKHQHVHVVIILRGQGRVLSCGEVFDVKPFDMVRIPSWCPHQLINSGDDPLGFLCTVNSVRDHFQLLNRNEVEELKENEEISRVIRIPEGYFDEKSGN